MDSMGFNQKNKKLAYSSGFKKLRILLLTWEFPPHIVGGLARHSEGLSVYLQKNGIDVTVITTKTPKIVQAFEEVQGVKVYRVEPLNAMDNQFLNWVGGLNMAMAEKAFQISNEEAFDIIHAHDWLVGEAAQTLSKYLNIPLITTIHATEHGRNGGIFTELQRFIHQKEDKLIQSSNHLIVCSEYMKEEIVEIFSYPGEKISIIPNGVVIDKPSIQGNFHPLLQFENRNILFSIGRLVKEKGFDLLIEAAAKMKRKDVCFVIAGIGPMFQEYERKIKSLALENSIYLIGFISDEQRNQFFEKCTMAILPSRYEPFGIVALEAMKFSKPIIVSATGGLKGINKHLETGLFMEPNNVDSLVSQIEMVLNQPELAEQMAKKGKDLVDQFYSWQRVAEMTKRIYEDQHLFISINEGQYELNFRLC
ncbi:glycosyltransferase family 4 protein [Neobacillus sp. D3-1R]|uniref:glycosyltransferase family 4 protein n=1 Tax=Neobacillus sp. D3-1R TaxID=3445778 RepID=UPI003FA10010